MNIQKNSNLIKMAFRVPPVRADREIACREEAMGGVCFPSSFPFAERDRETTMGCRARRCTQGMLTAPRFGLYMDGQSKGFVLFLWADALPTASSYFLVSAILRQPEKVAVGIACRFLRIETYGGDRSGMKEMYGDKRNNATGFPQGMKAFLWRRRMVMPSCHEPMGQSHSTRV